MSMGERQSTPQGCYRSALQLLTNAKAEIRSIHLRAFDQQEGESEYHSRLIGFRSANACYIYDAITCIQHLAEAYLSKDLDEICCCLHDLERQFNDLLGACVPPSNVATVSSLHESVSVPPIEKQKVEFDKLSGAVEEGLQHLETWSSLMPDAGEWPVRDKVDQTANTSDDGGTSDQVKLTAVERALVIYTRDPNQSIRAIARQAGCHPSLLSRDERFQRLRQAHVGNVPRGRKPKGGDIEAEAD